MTTIELADICEAMENAVIDVQVEFERDSDPPITKEELAGTNMLTSNGPTKYYWAAARPFADRSFSTEQATFLNESGKTWDEIRKQSYNGEIAKVLNIYNCNTSCQKFEGTITKSKRFILHGTVTPLNYTILRFSQEPYNYPLSKALRQQEWVEIDNSIRSINGFNTIKVVLFMQGVRNKAGEKVPVMHIYFSVDHAYTPVKFQDVSRNEPGFSVDVTELEKVSEGLWYPKAGRMIWPEKERVDLTARTLTYKAISIKVNQGLTDKDFDISFPPGTMVNDEITLRAYTIKPTQEQLNQSLSPGQPALSSGEKKSSSEDISMGQCGINSLYLCLKYHKIDASLKEMYSAITPDAENNVSLRQLADYVKNKELHIKEIMKPTASDIEQSFKNDASMIVQYTIELPGKPKFRYIAGLVKSDNTILLLDYPSQTQKISIEDLVKTASKSDGLLVISKNRL
jgi:hypothetical protein